MDSLFKICATVSLLGSIQLPYVAYAQTYDALPLRGVLSDKPHFQTADGRSGYRFASAEINKYRLYDFYARQARYHMAQNKFKKLLLPFPGLEGGRRGHWGVTNEKLSSAVTNRNQEPRYHRLVNRGPGGEQYVCFSHESSQSLCFFKGSSPSMTKVVLSAKLRAPVHAFSHQVDRFGFGMSAKGDDYLVNPGSEWWREDGKVAEVTTNGYHLYQDKVIFYRVVDEVAVLDMPTVTYHGDIAIYSRNFEWMGDSVPHVFLMPLEAKLLNQPGVKIQQNGGVWTAVVSDGVRRLVHRVQCSEQITGLSLRVSGGRVRVQLPAMKKGARLRMDTWIRAAAEKGVDAPLGGAEILSTCLNGGPRFFTEDVTVKGVLNADPMASGTSYSIDEIPVPSENPYGMPMTLSGLAFAKDGSAYVSTLVGDVWKVTGLDASLGKVRWQRFASGLNSPLGLEVIDGVLHVLTQHQVLQLRDLNGDGEADDVSVFVKVGLPAGRLHDLQSDSGGNLYFTHASGVHRISPDGKKISRISGGSRNPLGLAVRPDGLALSDSSEGNNGNGTCSIFESHHAENQKTVARHKRILYLPRGVDNSPGSRLFVSDPRFGPMGNSLLGLSYGAGRFYQILRDANNGSPQAALQLLPGEFSSGAVRLATNPKDGQVYVVGMDGWGDYATKEGSLSRIRYTGQNALVPMSWQSYSNGISVRFNQAIDSTSVTAGKVFLQQWNYIDSQDTYGSAEYSVKHPDQIGHDRLEVKGISFSDDGKEMFVNAPEILPAMCTQIFCELKSRSGDRLTLDLYATINQLPEKMMRGVPSPCGKKRDLVVPFKNNNGNTYATITTFFDKLAGRDAVVRAVGPVVAYKKNELNYQWIKTNIIEKQACITCHAVGAKYDFSSYASLMKAIDLKHPEKSHLLGMIRAGSMPPFPMPTVAPEMQQALRDWIAMGAPE